MANEKRLIDANALADKVDESKYNNPHPQGMVRVNHRNEHDHFLRMIMDAPTVDAVEVVHGRWVWDIETHGDPMYGVDEDFGYRCSECQVWADEYGVDGDIYEEPPTDILHYCPNCGAKMDGERKDNG